MRAITLTGHGDPEVMRIGEVADPVPAPGEVVLDVHATAVNRADLLQRRGFYPPPPGASEILGLECSGVVAAVGTGVTDWRPGDEACALLAGGGYAEKVAVPAGQLMPIPAGLDVVTAASLPEVACTVWSNLVMECGLRAGETVLIHGGAGGIGTHAVQVARALGARVAVTAGSADKLDICRDLGAEILIDYRRDDFVGVLREVGGADVILDNMGAKYLQRNIDALAMDGRLVIIGMQGGVKGEVNIAKLLNRRGHVLATGLRARPSEGPRGKAAVCTQVVENVWPMVADGRVRPMIHTSLPLADAAAAHELLDSGAVSGKILLEVTR